MLLCRMLANFEKIITELETKGIDLEFFGAVPDTEINQAEMRLGVNFPEAYKQFLRKWGRGGMAAGSQISGLVPGNPLMESFGTVVGDTEEARQRFGIDRDYIIIHAEVDEIYWGLKSSDSTCTVVAPVYSIDVLNGNKVKKISESFPSLLSDYFSSWLE